MPTVADVQSFAGGDSTGTVTDVGVEPTSTRTISDLVEDAGHLHNRAGLHVQDATELRSATTQLHTDTVLEMLRARASSHATQALQQLLAVLDGRGLAWRDIARLVGVSVPALRKWRNGEPATGENLLKVARLVALCEVLEEQALITDPASWLEVPLVDDVPVTGLDLYAGKRVDLLIRHALHNEADPEELLDEFRPGWREEFRGTFEFFTAEDGMPGLRLRDSDG
jgi:transcriptional regulator with XRE-family HTH domain